MTTQAEIQSQLDALNKSISSGSERVTYADKTIVYRSLAEMKEVKGDLEKALETSRAVKQYRVFVNKGF